jgi:hypothetical protein
VVVTGPVSTVTVAARFCGPPGSGNGGYVAGRLAAYVEDAAAVSVTLRKPPPLDVPLVVDAGGGSLRLVQDGAVIAEAEAGAFERPVPPAVGIEQATAAEPSYPGLRTHPFPTCFVCGPERIAGDGLALMPGRTADGRTACTWTPDATLEADDPERGLVAAEFVWSALDCPGGWASDIEARPLVLGRITAAYDRLPSLGEKYVVVGALYGSERRKTFTAAALYDRHGSLLARAEHVWIAVDPAQL